MTILDLVRLAFARRKHRLNLLDGVLERGHTCESAAQMGYGNKRCFGVGSVGDYGLRDQFNLHDPAEMAQGGYSVEIKEWCGGAARNGDLERLLRGERRGIVCHDGSYRFWEWDSAKACFVAVSSLK
jgi:hypothetical protein